MAAFRRWAASTPSETTRFVHGPRGLERQQGDSGAWLFPVGDGLDSVRGMLNNDWPSADVLGTRQYAPYGAPFGAEGAVDTPFGFTGEQVDGNDLVYLRARYYAPGLGVFASRDPWEGEVRRSMSMNGYSWVEGNVANVTDPTGFQSAATICWTIAGTSPTIGEEAICLGLTFWELFKAITPATSIYTPDVVSRFVTSQTIRHSDIPASSAALGYFSTLPQGTTFAEGLSGYFIAECGNLTDPTHQQDCVITTVNQFLGELGLDEDIKWVPPDDRGGYAAGGVGVAEDILLEHGICSPGLEWVLDALSAQSRVSGATSDERTDRENADLAYRNPRREEHPAALTQGFRPKARTPDEFARGPAFHVTRGSEYATRFISLTRSMMVAKDHQSPGLPIYVINLLEVIGVVLDFTIPSVRDEYLRYPIVRNFATASQEVLVDGWIPPQAIKGLIP